MFIPISGCSVPWVIADSNYAKQDEHAKVSGKRETRV